MGSRPCQVRPSCRAQRTVDRLVVVLQLEVINGRKAHHRVAPIMPRSHDSTRPGHTGQAMHPISNCAAQFNGHNRYSRIRQTKLSCAVYQYIAVLLSESRLHADKHESPRKGRVVLYGTNAERCVELCMKYSNTYIKCVGCAAESCVSSQCFRKSQMCGLQTASSLAT